jgi:hypothetical protein
MRHKVFIHDHILVPILGQSDCLLHLHPTHCCGGTFLFNGGHNTKQKHEGLIALVDQLARIHDPDPLFLFLSELRQPYMYQSHRDLCFIFGSRFASGVAKK